MTVTFGIKTIQKNVLINTCSTNKGYVRWAGYSVVFSLLGTETTLKIALTGRGIVSRGNAHSIE